MREEVNFLIGFQSGLFLQGTIPEEVCGCGLGRVETPK